MNFPVLPRSVSLRTRPISLLAIVLAGGIVTSASAQLAWDPDGITPNAQGGAGNWLTSNGGSPWWNGTTNVPWTDGSSAILGGATGTIVTGGIIVDDITFDTVHRLGDESGSPPITLGLGNGVHTITTNANGTISPRLEGTEGLVKEGVGVLNLGTSGTYSGPTLINAGTLSAQLLTSGRVTIASGATYKALVESSIGSLAGAGSVDVQSQGSLTTGADDSSTTFSGIITGEGIDTTIPGGSLVKAGAGAFTLTGANTYKGSTTISTGVLELGGVDTISQSSNVLVEAAGTLRLLSNQSIQRLNGAGSLELGANALSFKNTTLTSGLSLGGLFAGTISGAGSFQIADNAILTLSGNNSFTGGLTIGGESSVTVTDFGNAGVNSPLGPGSVTLGTGGLFYGGANDATSDRPITIASGEARLGVTSPNVELTLSGAITGGSGIDIFGSGRVHLLGDKAFSGSYTVQSGGTLRLEGNFSANTFSVSGTLETVGSSRSVGALAIGGPGVLSPGGNGIEAALNTANLTLNGGVLALDLRAAGHDQLNVTGALSLNAPVRLALQLDYEPEDFVDVIRLIVNDDTDSISFLDANARFVYGSHVLQEGDIFLVSSGSFSQQFQMRYGLDGDNDVRLVAMPEPGAAGLFAVAGVTVLGVRRRKIPRDKSAGA